MAFVLSRLERLAVKANRAIVLCHHASEASLAAGTSNQAHAAQGSSIITDNARWQCNLSVPANQRQFKGMSNDQRKRHALFEFAKLNYGPPREPRLLVRGDGGAIRFAAPDDQPSTTQKPRPARKSDAPRPQDLFKLPQLADA